MLRMCVMQAMLVMVVRNVWYVCMRCVHVMYAMCVPNVCCVRMCVCLYEWMYVRMYGMFGMYVCMYVL